MRETAKLNDSETKVPEADEVVGVSAAIAGIVAGRLRSRSGAQGVAFDFGPWLVLVMATVTCLPHGRRPYSCMIQCAGASADTGGIGGQDAVCSDA